MEQKDVQIISCYSGKQKVMGEIIKRSESYIMIRITYPFVGWVDDRDSESQNLLTEEGEELAKTLLCFGYEKLKRVDTRMHKYMQAYNELLEDLSEVPKLQDSMQRKRANLLLKVWFLEFIVFQSWKTRWPFTYYEVDYFMKIFDEYKSTGVKIYLAKEN